MEAAAAAAIVRLDLAVRAFKRGRDEADIAGGEATFMLQQKQGEFEHR